MDYLGAGGAGNQQIKYFIKSAIYACLQAVIHTDKESKNGTNDGKLNQVREVNNRTEQLLSIDTGALY